MKLSHLILTTIALSLLACRKDPTVINGIVIDKDTKLPIAGAAVQIRESYEDDPYDYSEYNLKTDGEGKFHYSSQDRINVYRLHGGDLYVPILLPYYDIVQGESNDLTIEMLPYDCSLDLVIKHSFAQTDKAYYSLFNKSISDHSGSLGIRVPPSHSQIPSLIKLDSTYTEKYRLRSGEYTYIYLDTLPSSGANPFMLKDSVFLSKGESRSYFVEF